MGCTIPVSEIHFLARLADIALQNKTNEARHYVRIEASDGSVRADVCNGEDSASCQLLAEGEIVAAIPAKVVHKFAARDADLHLENDGDSVSFKQGPTSGTFQSVDPGTVPQHDCPDMSSAPSFDGETLRAAVKTAAACADSGAGSRFALNGAQFMLTGDSMSVTGTDGRKVFSVDVSCDSPGEFSVIVPAKSLKNIQHMKSQTFKIAANARSITFSDGTTSYTSSLLQGRFPDVNKLLRKPDDAQIIACETSVLLDGARGVIWDDGERSFLIDSDGITSADGQRKYAADLSDEFDQRQVSIEHFEPLVKSFDSVVVYNAGGDSPLYVELGDSARGMIATMGK